MSPKKFETNAIQQSKELLDFGVPVLHYYSMGKSDNIKVIASQLF
jgi:methylenetetrahydrofolate reductase (NADPH)